MQLSPIISRLLGRRCKEEKERKALSQYQCCLGLAKIRYKPSSRLGVRSSCGFSCYSQGQPHCQPYCWDHASAWRLFGCPSHFYNSQEQDKSLGSPFSHPTASQNTTNHLDISTPNPPLASSSFRAPYLAYLPRQPHFSLKKIFEDDSLPVCGNNGVY